MSKERDRLVRDLKSVKSGFAAPYINYKNQVFFAHAAIYRPKQDTAQCRCDTFSLEHGELVWFFPISKYHTCIASNGPSSGALQPRAYVSLNTGYGVHVMSVAQAASKARYKGGWYLSKGTMPWVQYEDLEVFGSPKVALLTMPF